MQPPARICLSNAFQFYTKIPYKSDDAMFLPLARCGFVFVIATHGVKKTNKKAPVWVLILNSLKKSEF